MMGETRRKWAAVRMVLLLLFAPEAFAQESQPVETPAPPAFTQAELDQMLAPVALYPDSLLSSILTASTYPLDVVEAARWSRSNPRLVGPDAVHAVEDRPWDPSVKALVAFPRVLAEMDEKLEWTRDLGDAYAAQPAEVMDSVQHLRRQAYAAGSLRSSDQYLVEDRNGNIAIEPRNPEVVYVPYYDPRVAYGPWEWPAYPPVYWAPWPGYYAYADYPGLYWGPGIFVGAAFFFVTFDWPVRQITIINVDHRLLTVRRFDRDDLRHRRIVGRHRFERREFAHTRDFDHMARDTRGSFHRSPSFGERGLSFRPPSRADIRTRPMDGAASRLGPATRLGSATRLGPATRLGRATRLGPATRLSPATRFVAPSRGAVRNIPNRDWRGFGNGWSMRSRSGFGFRSGAGDFRRFGR
jgi:Protein of unknown function (DUF3300)